MTNKECAEILKNQCAYGSIRNPFIPMGEVNLWDALNHVINVLEKTSDESDYERGMNDIWEALRCYNDMCFSDRIHYYAAKAPIITTIDILRYHSYQEFMTMHKAAVEKKESEVGIKRGDMIKCSKEFQEFDAIYLGENSDLYFVLEKGVRVPQDLSKSVGWTLTKIPNKHVDLDSVFDE